MMDEETIETEEKEVIYTSVVFKSTISASKGEETATQNEGNTEVKEVTFLNAVQEPRNPTGGNGLIRRFKCLALFLAILCLIMACGLTGLSSYFFLKSQKLNKDLEQKAQGNEAKRLPCAPEYRSSGSDETDVSRISELV